MERLGHLDNLKVVLTAGVIAAHAAMTYGAVGTWVYEEDTLTDPGRALLGALVAVGVMFGLGLFFLVAGLLTSGPLDRDGSRRYLSARAWRLGLPLVAYVLLVWPLLQWWVDRVTDGDRRTFWRYWLDRFSGTRLRSIGSGPMWFVAILLVVTTAWAGWRAVHPAAVLAQRVPIGRRQIVTAAAAIAPLTFLLRVAFPIDSAQVLDLHLWLWPQSMVLFVVGALAAEHGWVDAVPDTVRRGCRWAIAGACAWLAVLILLSDGPEPFKGGLHWEAAGFAVFEGVFSTCMSLLVLEHFRRRHAHTGRLGRRLARAAYAAFALQGPVLTLTALAMRSLDVAGEVKFALLATTSLVLCFGLPQWRARATPSVSHDHGRGPRA